MHLNTGKYILLVGVSSLIGEVCAMPLDEHDPDPAGTLADDGEWWDEGPPDGSADPADAGDDDDLAVTSEALSGGIIDNHPDTIQTVHLQCSFGLKHRCRAGQAAGINFFHGIISCFVML